LLSCKLRQTKQELRLQDLVSTIVMKGIQSKYTTLQQIGNVGKKVTGIS